MRTTSKRIHDRRHPRPHFHAPPAGEAGGVPEVSLYARVTGIWRSRATRRRSCRAANRATARRAAQTTRSIMLTRRPAHSVPATHSVVLLELSGPYHLCAERGPSHYGLRDDIFRKGMIAAIDTQSRRGRNGSGWQIGDGRPVLPKIREPMAATQIAKPFHRDGWVYRRNTTVGAWSRTRTGPESS